MQRGKCGIRFLSGVIAIVPLTVKTAKADLAGYWAFNEGSGTTIYDSSGNGRDGTLGPSSTAGSQTPSRVTGSIPGHGGLGGAINTNGGEYASIPGGGGLDGSTSGTVGLWVNWTSNNQGDGFGDAIFGAVLSRQSDGNFTNDLLGLDGADPNSAHIVFKGASIGDTPLTSTVSPGVNQWHYIAVVFTPNSEQLYVDGLLNNTLNSGIGGIRTDPTTPLTIGAWAGDGHSYSTAMIDEVGVWNAPLSADSIANMAIATASPAVPEPASALMGAIGAAGLLAKRRRAQ